MSFDVRTRIGLGKLEAVVFKIADRMSSCAMQYFKDELTSENKSEESNSSLAKTHIEILARKILAIETPEFDFLADRNATLACSDGSNVTNTKETDLSPSAEKFLNLNCDIYWMMEAIDSPEQFDSRGSQWSINLSLVVDGEPVLAVVTFPCLNEIFIASQGNSSRYGAIGSSFEDLNKCKINSTTAFSNAKFGSNDAYAYGHRALEFLHRHLLLKCKYLNSFTTSFGFTRILCGGINIMISPFASASTLAAIQVLFDETPSAVFSTLHGHNSSLRYRMGSAFGVSDLSLGEGLQKIYNDGFKREIAQSEYELANGVQYLVQKSGLNISFLESFPQPVLNQKYSNDRNETREWIRALEFGVQKFKEKFENYLVEDVGVIISWNQSLSASVKNGKLDGAPALNDSLGVQVRAIVAGAAGLSSSTLPVLRKKHDIVFEALLAAVTLAIEKKHKPDFSILAYRSSECGHFGNENWGAEIDASLFRTYIDITKQIHNKERHKLLNAIQTKILCQREDSIQIFLDGTHQSMSRTSMRARSAVYAQSGDEKRSATRHFWKNYEVDKSEFEQKLDSIANDLSVDAIEQLSVPYAPESLSYDYLAIDADLLGLILHEALGHALEGDLVQGSGSGFGINGQMQPLTVAPPWISVLTDGNLDTCGQSFVDTEGVKSIRKTLVKNGIIVDGIHTRETARKARKVPDGCSRFQSVFHAGMNRMTNIWIHAEQSFALEDSSIQMPLSPQIVYNAMLKNGFLEDNKIVLFLSGWQGGTATCSNLEFRADVDRIYLFKKDAPLQRFRKANFTGIATACFRSAIAAFGPHMCESVGTCGKYSQGVMTSDGGPAILLVKNDPQIKVIGTGELEE